MKPDEMQQFAPAPWRNRIVRYGTADPTQLLANPLNFRIHPSRQQKALGGALDEIGWIDDVTINIGGGRDVVVDGHLRVALALSKYEQTGVLEEVPVKYVDLSLDEEMAALAYYDQITEMAVKDPDVLEQLLAEMPQPDSGALRELLDGLHQQVSDLRIAPPPTLADLANAVGGDYDERAFWPTLHVPCPIETEAAWNTAVKRTELEPHELLSKLLVKVGMDGDDAGA